MYHRERLFTIPRIGYHVINRGGLHHKAPLFHEYFSNGSLKAENAEIANPWQNQFQNVGREKILY